MFNRKKLYAQAKQWLEILKVDLDLRRSVEDLPVAQQQIVEIVKAISYEADIIVMDEPTAALAPHEVANLFKYIDVLKSRGKTVIFISHRLDEVFEIADSITILKDGAVVASRPAAELTKDAVVRLMVGRELKETFPPQRQGVAGAPVLEMRGVSSNGRLRDISLTVRSGEVVGVAGLEGQGQRELSRILFGMEPLTQGEILLNGAPADLSSPIGAIQAGVAFVSDDRKGEGLQLPLSIRRNISLPSLPQLSRMLFVREGEEKAMTNAAAAQVDIRAPSLEIEVGNLSGGNQQKTVLAKWLSRDPILLVFNEPTRGIDVGAKVEIYHLMRELAEQGKAIVMVSSDLLEVLGMSDRIVVMHRGQIAAELSGATATEEEIMRAATGYSEEDEPEIRAMEAAVQAHDEQAASAEKT